MRLWQVRAGYYLSRSQKPIGKVRMGLTGADIYLQSLLACFKKIRDQGLSVLNLIGDGHTGGMATIFLFGLNNLRRIEKTDEDQKDTGVVSG